MDIHQSGKGYKVIPKTLGLHGTNWKAIIRQMQKTEQADNQNNSITHLRRS